MKILSFYGQKINEYIDINIQFNDDMSIITGANGSGKTTALNLIHAILCPRFDEILKIPFETVNLVIDDSNNIYSIQILKNKRLIHCNLSKLGDTGKFELFLESLQVEVSQIDDIEYYKYKDKTEITPSDILLRKYNDHPIIEFIRALSSPIFVGLERTNMDVKGDYKDYLLERNIYFTKKNSEINSFRRKYKQTLGVSILETELLIQSIYKRLKSVGEHYSNSIQRQLIDSSFDYVEFKFEEISTAITFQENSKLLSRQNEIEETLMKIGILDKNLSKKLNSFFSNLDILFKSIDKNAGSQPITIEWLLNKAQIDKLTKLVEILDNYNSKVNEIFLPINKFVDIINSFFKDTGKKLYVDEVGRLSIKKPFGRDLTVDELSSGERQLIILFANVIFDKYKLSTTRNEVMIIDEPEISLHIRWQEKFIDFLIDASEKTQFIIATHSPDIIGDHKQKTVKLNSRRD